MQDRRLGLSRGRQAGVTLIELMIVLVIVAILATIAVPSYRQYTIRAHRTEAKSALLKLQTKEEGYYLQNNQYSADATALGFPGSVSENGVYTLNVATASAGQSFTATATPTAGGTMTDDTHCAEFSIDNQGTQGATNTDCW